MMRKISNTLLVFMLFSPLLWGSDTKGVWTLALENDMFGSSQDKHYTHGTEVSYASDTYHPKWLLNAAARLPFYSPDKDVRFGFSLGQSIFTPDDITRPDLIENDRPYAGWLYANFSLFSDYRLLDREESRRNHNDLLELTLGIVGPSSRAESVQRWVHKKVDSDIPEGWDNQLKDEVGVNLAYMRQWQYELIPRYTDVTLRAGGMLGNVFTHAETGVMFRFGNHLGLDFGPPLIRPSNIGSRYFKPKQSMTWYFFTGVSGRYVGRNLFLDGNTFKSSHSVDKKNWVGDVQAGFVLSADALQISLTHILRTREFDGQPQKNEFGSLAFSYRI